MSFYLRADNESLTAKETMEKSEELMDGAKWKLFGIHLRITGLGILCLFTLGIGFLWLSPYSNVLSAQFYLDLIKDSKSNPQQQIIDSFGEKEIFDI